MNLSRKWLHTYVDVADIDNKTYNDALTMSGSKIEGYVDEKDSFSRVVIGRVESVERHPNADKLFVCQVNVGSETVQICTSAQNLFAGAVVPVALDNSDLPGGVHITAGQMRGVDSNGMMCSFAELGLTEHDCPEADPNGIWILNGEYTLGEEVTTALGLDDTCVEFEITPNRPDCLSMIGLARETAATFERPLNIPAPVVKGCGGNIHDIHFKDIQAKEVHLNSAVSKSYIDIWIKNEDGGALSDFKLDNLYFDGISYNDTVLTADNAEAEIRFSVPEDYPVDRGILHINTK